jgi:hypothetical protein
MIYLLIDTGGFLEGNSPPLTDTEIYHLAGGRVEAAFRLTDPLGMGDIVCYRVAQPVGLQPVSCVLGDAPANEANRGPLLIFGIDEHGRRRSLVRDEVNLFRFEPESQQSPARLYQRTGSGTLE